MYRRLLAIALALAIAGSTGFLFTATAQTAAQTPAQADAESLLQGYETYRSMMSESPYRGIGWSYLGPLNISGRATDIAVAERDGGRRVYAAYATSGIWVTDDLVSWRPVFDHEASTSIGDIAIAPSDPDIVWVGTGEANIFRASMAGVGVYKSTDAGRTWHHMGLTDTQTIGRIIIHPTDPDIVYVAASGHEWTDNEMRGVFKTTDGGITWEKIYYKSPRTGAIDLVMDPRNPDVLYASMWQRVRRKWSDPRVEPGYNEGGIFKTTDGGRTWTDANNGLVAPEFRGRIGIDISLSNPDTLYALIDNYEIGRYPEPGSNDAYGRPMPVDAGFIKGADIYRSDDGGATWRQTSRFDEETTEYLNRHSGTYGWVFGQIRVDPTNPDIIYSMGLGLNRSIDGGRTFSRVTGMHGDHHGLWIDPADSNVLYNANDGGFYHSTNFGDNWIFAVSAGGAQFYNVTLDTSDPLWAYGSIQDHGSRRGQIDLSQGRDNIPAVEWENAPGGEGSHHTIDPENPNIVYSHGFYGNFFRTDLGATPPVEEGGRGGRGGGRGRGVRTNIAPEPEDPEEELRAQWMAPIIISPHDNSVIFAGFQYVYKSENRGDDFERISPDLTNNDPMEIGVNPTAIPYQTIVALAESPVRQNVFYVGADDGRIHSSIDGTEWVEVTDRLPVRRWVSRIVPSEHDAGTVYITQRGREDDDFGVYVWKSTDYGRTFTSVAGNIPAGPVNVVREDPRHPDVLYAGTDFGVFVTTDGGANWTVLGGNLPSAQVSDLQYSARENLIVISTYGWGMWAFDATRVQLPG
jgi:photosystem II stability/assembly factor-like uncharacterized protein